MLCSIKRYQFFQLRALWVAEAFVSNLSEGTKALPEPHRPRVWAQGPCLLAQQSCLLCAFHSVS